jgi:hypothetical protein
MEASGSFVRQTARARERERGREGKGGKEGGGGKRLMFRSTACTTIHQSHRRMAGYSLEPRVLTHLSSLACAR